MSKILFEDDSRLRRIDDTNRLIYKVNEDNIITVKSCKGHYDDK